MITGPIVRPRSEHLCDLPHHKPQQVAEWGHEQGQDHDVENAAVVTELLLTASLSPRLDDHQEDEQRKWEG